MLREGDYGHKETRDIANMATSHSSHPDPFVSQRHMLIRGTGPLGLTCNTLTDGAGAFTSGAPLLDIGRGRPCSARCVPAGRSDVLRECPCPAFSPSNAPR